ncbi:MAG TPA: PTS glucose transporter subunit IIA [Candidatus Lachnoclostridium pullistercoris]|uniref:PTS glucose transporter subunit IIA n=1 Tax=Candidatus Lachnoclostridium pullistercoris TaxID=2838632 RepID=A0A9D2PGS6_9FIRM|nr:PTS glucose transporter subunit IIA [Candidatus Lachnoclostridium pullistercoris]
MFKLFKKKEKAHVLGAVAKGQAVPLSQVNDPTFSQAILGEGAAVIPSEGKIYAPADGKVEMVFDALHALSITADFGAEILIHVGLDTVQLKGQGFEAHVKAGDQVKKGDLLLTVDLDQVKAAGYDTIIPVIICNTADFEKVEAAPGGEKAPGDDFITVTEK